jgi:uncharacterized protein (DUF58 family)
MDFDESRIYLPGDDVRLIDWRVTARSGKTHTKVYREERERPVYCLCDFSQSMWFATRGNFKAVIAAQAASLIAWAAAEHGDRLGGVIFNEQTVVALKPTAGNRGVLRLLNRFAEQRPDYLLKPDPDNFAKALLQLRHVARPGSLIFILSDGAKLTAMAEQHLARLSQHCEIMFGFVFDPLEKQLPNSGIYTMSDGRQQMSFDSSDMKFAKNYQAAFLDQFERIKKITQRYRTPLFSLETSNSVIDTLRNVFCQRKVKS